MLIDLRGQVAIVTGGGRGIGRVIARSLAVEGVRVVVTDIRKDLLEEVAAEAWAGATLLADVRNPEDARAVAAKAEMEFGRIDLLVNNAGVATGGQIETLDTAVWDANIDTNLSGLFHMCQAVIPAMKRQKRGRIVSASSFAAIVPSIGGAAYAASKAAVHAFTRVLASELGPHEITVNCYAPGMIPTEMNHIAEWPPERKEMLLDTLSLRRWGDPQDVANLICFLASDLASYITGSLIDVSGGKYATQLPWLVHREQS